MSGEAADEVGADCPPPYAVVAAGGADAKPHAEPPPPYSACYVAYSATNTHAPPGRDLHDDGNIPEDISHGNQDYSLSYEQENASAEQGYSTANENYVFCDQNGGLNIIPGISPEDPNYGILGDPGCSDPANLHRDTTGSLHYIAPGDATYGTSDDALHLGDANTIIVQMDRDCAPRERYFLV
ncbi:uncharacterized protein LOC126377414 [Pectinophora gossypiella]|uniref:uncharacterized protein LOC126377414 n=1 Tax=Pectinophora gossypiella TaxID=13191 RepID=UPI00214F59FA|nr:uncharacterized protein LOC126377414 [Pectinophora gossypiella]